MCQRELSHDSEFRNGSYVVGEQAHIVGEKEDAPRGKSPLTLEERNTYHNMILLELGVRQHFLADSLLVG